MRVITAVLLLVSTAAADFAHARTADGLDPLPGDTRPSRYKLLVELDTEHSRYSTHSTITFEVLRPTSRIVMHARELSIDEAQLDSGEPARIAYDTARQQMSFEFTRPLARGEHQLRIAYSAPIGTSIESLFQVSYPDPGGTQRKMYFTHLCCIATGRRFMPLWDRPDMKAVFELELIVPTELEAVSNMPVVKRELLPSGMSRVTFQPTPRMSSYLLFFGVGAFDRVSEQVGSARLSVLTQRGKSEHGRFALQASADVLRYYNDYFQSPYPLPKLDAVTFPGAGAFGAMENWGAMFFFEDYMLIDPALSADEDRQRVYQVMAHEVSHQWFGNLVTMKDWSDLWLNEGFASWMATNATDHFHPEWHMWLHASEDRESAMRLDARASTHPIIRKVQTLEQAELAFDDITYQKGSQVIRMIEAQVGQDAFREAIRAHMRNHAYGNAVTADLWKELERVAPVPVSAIARDFTEQGGVPLIDVVSTKCISGSTRVLLRQGRFGLDQESRKARSWSVPVTAAVAGSDRIAHQVIHGARTVPLEVPGCGAVKINVGETSYFRTRYDPQSFAGLEQAFERLAPADELGLLNDTYSLGEAGYVNLGDYLEIASRLTPASDPLLSLQLVRCLLALDRLYSGLDSQEPLRIYARSRMSDLLAAVGWSPRGGESANTSILQATLIEGLATLGDRATIAEANRRFHSISTDSRADTSDTRRAIINAVGSGADAATFDEITRLARESANTAEKHAYYVAAARASDPQLARQMLDLTVTDQIPVQLSAVLITTVAAVHPALAFDFVTSKFDLVSRRLESSARIWFVPALAAYGVDTAAAEKLTAFARQRIGAAGSETVERARSKILLNAETRQRRLPQVDAWLRQHPQFPARRYQ